MKDTLGNLGQKKKILYFDMDGVLVDFESGINKLDLTQKKEFEGRFDEVPGIFSLMIPMEGAIDAFNELFDLFDCYILSTAPWENPNAQDDKKAWLRKYIGDEKIKKRLTITHNKNLNIGDFLIDDRTKNGAAEFTGEHIHFGTEKFPNWKIVVEYLRSKV